MWSLLGISWGNVYTTSQTQDVNWTYIRHSEGTANLTHWYTFHRRSKKPGRQCLRQQENWVEIPTILLTFSGIIIRFEHSWIINITCACYEKRLLWKLFLLSLLKTGIGIKCWEHSQIFLTFVLLNSAVK